MLPHVFSRNQQEIFKTTGIPVKFVKIGASIHGLVIINFNQGFHWFALFDLVLICVFTKYFDKIFAHDLLM